MATRLFYGWWVVLSFAVMAFLSSGIRFGVGPFLAGFMTQMCVDTTTRQAAHLGSLAGFLAEIKPLEDVAT